jgi:hypothetical protein
MRVVPVAGLEAIALTSRSCAMVQNQAVNIGLFARRDFRLSRKDTHG